MSASPQSRLATILPVYHVSYRYPHHARRSGHDRLSEFIGEPLVLSPVMRVVGNTLLRLPAIAAARRSGNTAYSRNDFIMELQAGLHMLRHRRSIYHVLYGEKSYRYLGHMVGRNGNALIATFHQPPEVFPEHVANPAPLRRLTAAVAVAGNQVEMLEQYVGKGRVFVAPHGVDTDFFVPAATPKADGPMRLLCVGHHLRDFDMLATVMGEVLKNRRDAEFTLICFKRFVGEMHWGERVRWIRRLTDAEYVRHLQEADLLVLPLRTSTAVTVVLESMACGLPVVTTRGGIADYLDENSGVMVNVDDAPAMISAVLDLLSDDAGRARMGEAARRRALRFSWPGVAREMQAVYERVAEGLNGSGA
ncbi:MAG: glycosyltransferase family 4 protein [Phycisphaerae bacterium]|nr:glycosyltransferase family 4 protein [Phycisphaerae bacterium]